MSDTKQPCPYCRGAKRVYAHVQDDTGIECPYCSPLKKPTGARLTAEQIVDKLRDYPHCEHEDDSHLTVVCRQCTEDAINAALQCDNLLLNHCDVQQMP